MAATRPENPLEEAPKVTIPPGKQTETMVVTRVLSWICTGRTHTLVVSLKYFVVIGGSYTFA